MKNTKRLLLTITSAIVVFSLGAGAATASTAIKAALNKVLAITVDGEAFQPKDSKGNRLYPIVYNGITYVPATAFANALGAEAAYVSKGNGTIAITSGIDATPTEDMNSSGGNTSSNSNVSNSVSTDSKLVSVAYDANKKSTWVKFTGVKIEAKTSADGKKYFLVSMDITNRSSSTVDFKSYGDIRLMDKNDNYLGDAILTSGKTKATLKAGESTTVVKAFTAASANDLAYITYYPLTAAKGDSTKVYINK